MTMSSFIPEIWNERLVAALSSRSALVPELFPEPSESVRQWVAYRAANSRWVEIPLTSMSATEASAAILSAAEGLQNTLIEWGDEMSGPAVQGFIAGSICDYPGDSGPCPQLLGHSGKHG